MSSFLDASRWIAALLVVIGHIRQIVNVDFGSASTQNGLTTFFYFITGFGHESVVVFFVISGFLVGGVTLERWQKSGVSLSEYFVSRTARIYTVLPVALAIGWALDLAGSHWIGNDHHYFVQQDPEVASSLAVNQMLFSTFVGNLFNVENIFVPILGTNGPLWSLAYEWWYYCLFAFVASGLMTNGQRRVFLLSLAVLLTAILPWKFLLWMSVWLTGVAAYPVYRRKGWKPHPLAGFAVFTGVAIAVRIAPKFIPNAESTAVAWALDFVLGLAYAFALVSLANLKRELPFARAHQKLAGFSFTLYVTHAPFMVFAISCAEVIFGLTVPLQPNIAGLTFLFGVMLAIYAYSWFFSLLTEAHTGRVRIALKTLIQPLSRRAMRLRRPALPP
ncbi:MAG: O-antigen acetylase [Herminiimonas sp.]|nr:O-antigen acetylase [Herminiimonas sp.]